MQIQSGLFTILLFIGYVVLWRIKKVELEKHFGTNPNVLTKATRPIQKYFSQLELIMTPLVVIIIGFHFLPNSYFCVIRQLGNLNSNVFDIAGFIIGILGLSICRVAQVTIGKSWRVGIDENAKPGLIKTGIYKFVRNPTYTGLYVMCIGILLINPTILFSYWVLAFFLMMEFQVRCEEEYLDKIYGDEYKQYLTSTKRYIPLIY
jgi:protein-S-isoprenylcysteine O-methyltransferase Ste14